MALQITYRMFVRHGFESGLSWSPSTSRTADVRKRPFYFFSVLPHRRPSFCLIYSFDPSCFCITHGWKALTEYFEPGKFVSIKKHSDSSSTWQIISLSRLTPLTHMSDRSPQRNRRQIPIASDFTAIAITVGNLSHLFWQLQAGKPCLTEDV